MYLVLKELKERKKQNILNNRFSGKKVKTVTNILGERLLLGWSEERESFEKIVFMEMEGERHSFQAGGRTGAIMGSWVGVGNM